MKLKLFTSHRSAIGFSRTALAGIQLWTWAPVSRQRRKAREWPIEAGQSTNEYGYGYGIEYIGLVKRFANYTRNLIKCARLAYIEYLKYLLYPCMWGLAEANILPAVVSILSQNIMLILKHSMQGMTIGRRKQSRGMCRNLCKSQRHSKLSQRERRKNHSSKIVARRKR